ncbi:MAG: hypothetical protein IPH26_05860 [Sterolibacteriaceae bacterium]|uniref:Uncharacterized protein n=1 Tax=Candidatus Methylophosphatis roskildensis TaxID=2899263 RepID=A0A9D7DX70_9PROT|nr:hypothetical protein [Candidatus Methylophosphatis roskildensis]
MFVKFVKHAADVDAMRRLVAPPTGTSRKMAGFSTALGMRIGPRSVTAGRKAMRMAWTRYLQVQRSA